MNSDFRKKIRPETKLENGNGLQGDLRDHLAQPVARGWKLLKRLQHWKILPSLSGAVVKWAFRPVFMTFPAPLCEANPLQLS